MILVQTRSAEDAAVKELVESFVAGWENFISQPTPRLAVLLVGNLQETECVEEKQGAVSDTEYDMLFLFSAEQRCRMDA